tara:strand:- start:3462 stop:4517 length:1056 start_codon:yes stop_codon:yes gene_type:complete
MAEIFKFFTPDDIVAGDIQTISQPIWSENMNPYSQSYASGIGFFTSSTQLSQSGDYYMNVYHRNPQTDPNAAVQFAIAYGHRKGSGSYGDPNTTGQNQNDTPSRAIYSQYRNMLLPPTDTAFTFASDTPDDIVVLNVARARFRQKVDPGNWEIRLGSGSVSSTWGTAFRTFIDASGQGETPTINEAGRVFGIFSGSGGVTASSTQYGLFYPDQGVLIFNAARLKTELGIAFDSRSADVLDNIPVQPRNHVTMSARISGSSYFQARSEEKVTSTHYFVRITNKQFNFSNNPTFVTGSSGQFLHTSMVRNPSVYVTTIGMYDTINRLVAVAKLSRPLLKSFNREALIKVKLDY